ncbi:MAG: hypothetical protein ABIG90_03680 [bacterium]
METIEKKIILWVAVSASMVIVLIIWLMSLKSYNFSKSKEQVQGLKDQVQEKIQEIDMPDLNLDATPEEPQLKLPLEE